MNISIAGTVIIGKNYIYRRVYAIQVYNKWLYTQRDDKMVLKNKDSIPTARLERAREEKPKLIWCGATAYVREFPFK